MPARMNVQLVPVLAGLLPLMGVMIAFVLSARAGHIPHCFPLIEGCTTISATGRQPPGSFWYKGLMIPGAVFMAVYWKLATDWLRAMGDRGVGVQRLILILGITAAVGLIYYNMVLGHIGEYYRLQRRIGVILYFGLCSLAQILLTSRLYLLRYAFPHWIYCTKLALCALILVWGWLNILLSAFYAGFDGIEDIFEWNIAMLNVAYFLSTYFLWRSTRFHAVLEIRA